jgi:hypothetical protein
MARAMLAPFEALAAARTLEASVILAIHITLPGRSLGGRHVSSGVSASRGAGGCCPALSRGGDGDAGKRSRDG